MIKIWRAASFCCGLIGVIAVSQANDKKRDLMEPVDDNEISSVISKHSAIIDHDLIIRPEHNFEAEETILSVLGKSEDMPANGESKLIRRNLNQLSEGAKIYAKYLQSIGQDAEIVSPHTNQIHIHWPGSKMSRNNKRYGNTAQNRHLDNNRPGKTNGRK